MYFDPQILKTGYGLAMLITVAARWNSDCRLRTNCSVWLPLHAEAKLHCFHFLQEAISLSTYRDILTIGEQYNSTSLKDAAHEFIRVHSSEVLRDADFVTITKQEMVVYIRQRNRQVRHRLELLKAHLKHLLTIYWH